MTLGLSRLFQRADVAPVLPGLQTDADQRVAGLARCSTRACRRSRPRAGAWPASTAAAGAQAAAARLRTRGAAVFHRRRCTRAGCAPGQHQRRRPAHTANLRGARGHAHHRVSFLQAMPDFRGTKCTASRMLRRNSRGVFSSTTSTCRRSGMHGGSDEAAAHGQLVEPGLRHGVAAGRGDDAVVGRALRRMPGMPSPNSRCTLAQAEGPQVARAPSRAGRAGARCCRPRWPHRPAPRPGSRSRCRSPARGPARPPARQPRRPAAPPCAPPRWLGDRLAQPDRQAGVFVGLVDQRAVDEAVRARCGPWRPARAHRQCRTRRRRVTMRVRTACESRPTPAGAAACGSACGVRMRTLRQARGLAAAPAVQPHAGNRRAGKPGPRLIAAPRSGPCEPDQSRRAPWSVRSTCSGVTDTRPLAVAWKSVPSAPSLGSAGAADPVHGLAARTGLRDHRLGWHGDGPAGMTSNGPQLGSRRGWECSR